MEILLNRRLAQQQDTIGDWIFVSNNNARQCNTLEPVDRGLKQTDPLDHIQQVKVPAKTAIPTGRYQILITYSPEFGTNMPEVMDVPGFEGVRIHVGNSAKDTKACILLGDYHEGDQNFISHSADEIAVFEDIINRAIKERNEEVWLTISNSDLVQD